MGERIRWCNTRGADTSLARPGRKQARKHVRDARDFNNIETRAVKFFFLQGKAPKETHAILTETLACFLPVRAKELSAPLYYQSRSCYRTSYEDRSNWKYMNSLLSFFITSGRYPFSQPFYRSLYCYIGQFIPTLAAPSVT